MPHNPSIKAEAAKVVNAVSLKIPTPPTTTVRKAKGTKQRAADVRHNHGEWEPNAKELEMYWRHMRFETYDSIAKDFDCSHVWVWQVCKKVGVWKAKQAGDEIDAIRARAMDAYSHIIHEALKAWEKVRDLSLVSELVYDADGNVASVKVPTGSPGDGYLKTAILGLNEIRKLWAADKASVKDEAPDNAREDGSEGMRVAGKSQNVVFGELLEKLQARLKPSAN